MASTSVNADGTPEAERVIVTGSNIPTAAEVGPNPVDTYRRDDITRLGVRTSTDLIQKLPAAFGAGVNESTTSTSDGSASISLRGIDPKETLVLQDGRRLAGVFGIFVDFNLFPIGLIDHIDVLKDGASPVYGTDAVAGVVNVYLIHRFRGLELYSSYGNTNLGSANDMGQEIGYILAGTGDDKTNIVVFAEYFNQAAIFSRDLDLSRTLDYRPFGGADDRSLNFSGHIGGPGGPVDVVYQPSLNGGLKTPTPHAYPNALSDPQYVPRTSLPSSQQAFNFAQFTPIIAPSDREFFYGSFDRQICGDALTVFGDLEYIRRFWYGGVAPRPLQSDIWTDSAHPSGISSSGFSVPIQNAFNPFTVPDYVSSGGPGADAAPAGTGFTTGVRYRFLEAGVGTPKFKADYSLFTGGLRGNLGWAGDYFKTWNWETALRWNEDQHVELFGGLINNYAIRLALLDTNPATAFNPFGLNRNNREVLERIIITTSEVTDVALLTQDATLNGDLFQLPAGPVSFALGGQYLKTHLSDEPDAITAAGEVSGFATFAITKGGRDVWATFWEARVPLTSSTWNFPGAYSLEFSYAERFDDFSDFGSTERPKFSVRWQPFGGSPVPLTIRASYIEAFHAPALADLFQGTLVGFPPIFDPVTGNFTRGVPTDFAANPNLQPEIAYEHTIGGVITPEAWCHVLRGLTMTIDYGHIDLRNFITQPDPQFIVDNEAKFPGAVTRDPITHEITHIFDQTQNLGAFVQSYIDYEAVESFQTSWLGHGDFGTITATLNGTYLIDVRVKATPDARFQNVVGKFGGGFQGLSGGGSFTHNRWYGSLFYDGPARGWLSGVETGAIVHYIGQYWDSPFFTIDGQDRKIREWTTLDLIFNYTFHSPSAVAQNGIAGYDKQVGLSGKENKPASTEYNPCGWRAWLNNTTLSLGVNNVFNLAPPFVAAAVQATGAAENGFDEATANAKGRFWYVGLKKRF